MKKHIALGVSLLLTLGTAVAGTLMYGENEPSASVLPQENVRSFETRAVSPEMITQWKASAKTTDYITPKVPI
jgi:hypothetical protein